MDADKLIRRYMAGKRSFCRADLRGANLYGVFLRGADLRFADLSGADLRWASLRWANLYNANLRYANLGWADLHRADLRGTDLEWASLGGVDLRGAKLNGADLTGAYLRESNLGWADLSGALLRKANLTGATLTRAVRTGADLTETTMPDGTLYTGKALAGSEETKPIVGPPPKAAVRAARERAGLSQEALAVRVGVSKSTVGRWERDGAIPTNSEMRAEVAGVLGGDPWERTG